MTSDIRAKRRTSDWRRAPGISAGRTGEAGPRGLGELGDRFHRRRTCFRF